MRISLIFALVLSGCAARVRPPAERPAPQAETVKDADADDSDDDADDDVDTDADPTPSRSELQRAIVDSLTKLYEKR